MTSIVTTSPVQTDHLSSSRGQSKPSKDAVRVIGVDLAGLLGGGAWRVPKVSPCRVGWHMGRGVPSPAD